MQSLITISEGAKALSLGAIIAYPTEAVYGLGVDAHNEEAVKRLCALKERSLNKGLIVLVADLSHISAWIEPLTATQIQKLHQYDLGYHYTWLLPKSAHCPSYLSGQHESLAVRITSHPTAKQLCKIFNGAIVSTSANIQTLSSAKTINQVRSYFGEKIFGIVEGELGGLIEATKIQDVLTDEVFRG